MQEHLKWWQKPLRMIRRDFLSDFGEFKRIDLNLFALEAKERWHINCEWIMANLCCYPGCGHLVTFSTSKFEKAPGLGDFDLLRSYLPHARQYGIRVLAYINMHWYSHEFGKAHPGWEQLCEDAVPYGTKNPLYGCGTTFCVNSPWREWAFDMIRETMKTGVDGCFLDGPVFFSGACYCESCRSLYSRRTGGRELPGFMDWNAPEYTDFIKFRMDSWAAFLKEARTAATGVNPDAVIFLNGGGFKSSNGRYAKDAFRMEEHQDFTGAEAFFHVSESYLSPFTSLNLGRFLSAGKNPSVVFTHHAMSTWHYVPLSECEMRLALAASVAAGTNTWFAVFQEAMKHRAAEAVAAVESFNSFLEKNEPYYTQTISAAETAVLLSSNSLCFYRSAQKELGDAQGTGKEEDLVADVGKRTEQSAAQRKIAEEILDREYPGCLDALTWAHVPCRVLWDEHLMAAENLKKINLLILPNTACLSEEQIGQIGRFVESGGGLIATFESGFYDQDGVLQPRADWRRFLGIKEVAGAFHPCQWEVYMTVSREMGSGFAKDMLLPRTHNALKVIAEGDSEPLAFFMNPASYYGPLKGISPYPSVILSRRGKGRVIYVAGTLFESILRYHLDDHIRLVRTLAEIAAGGEAMMQVRTSAPGSLAVELRACDEGAVLHLVNTTGDMKRPIGEFIPIYDVDFSVKYAGVTAVRALRTDKDLEFRAISDRICFTVPVIHEYEAVLLKT